MWRGKRDMGVGEGDRKYGTNADEEAVGGGGGRGWVGVLDVRVGRAKIHDRQGFVSWGGE